MTPCDLLSVPDFTTIAGAGPAIIAGHEVCGVWPTACLEALDAFIATAPRLSLKAWIVASGATAIVPQREYFDLNTPEALARFRDRA